MQHHTKDKGDLGVLKAQLDLFQKGYMILLPQTEHAPFDLVIYKDGEFKRVQVKYRELNKKGIIEVRFRSSYNNSKGTVTKSIDKLEQRDGYLVPLQLHNLELPRQIADIESDLTCFSFW